MTQAIDAIELTADEADAVVAEVARQLANEPTLTAEALLARMVLKMVRQWTQRVVNDREHVRVIKSALSAIPAQDRAEFITRLAEEISHGR